MWGFFHESAVTVPSIVTSRVMSNCFGHYARNVFVGVTQIAIVRIGFA